MGVKGIAAIETGLGGKGQRFAAVFQRRHIQAFIGHDQKPQLIILDLYGPQAVSPSLLDNDLPGVGQLLQAAGILQYFSFCHGSLQISVVFPQALHIQLTAINDDFGHNITQQQQSLLEEAGHWLFGINLVLQIILGPDGNAYHQADNVL